MSLRRKPFQLSFATGALFKRIESLPKCGVCKRSFMAGFECHTCGIADYRDRLRAAAKTNRCITPGCERVIGTEHSYCDDAHQRVGLTRLRSLLLSSLHTSDTITPGCHHQGSPYARHIARIERVIRLNDWS